MDDNIGLERDSDTLNNLYSLLLACLANSEMDFVGSFNQIEKNISKIVSLEKIENMTNFGTISREDREYREVALIAGRGHKTAIVSTLSPITTRRRRDTR